MRTAMQAAVAIQQAEEDGTPLYLTGREFYRGQRYLRRWEQRNVARLQHQSNLGRIDQIAAASGFTTP